MTRRPPWTLWAYILWDLWRLILLTAAVLVTVIAFAAAVKPLADGKLGPVETLKFMFLAMPPMLQYALPFAACFGATLAYHRLTADNELIAAHAGGVSHRTLIVPALFTGILLAVVILVLSNRIIPSYLRKMADLISQDVSKFIEQRIKDGEAVKLGDDRFLYADVVSAQGPDVATGAFQKLWLGGLLVVKLDKHGNVDTQASAREATVWLRRVDSAPGSAQTMTQVVIRPRDGIVQRGGSKAEFDSTDQEFFIPNTFADDPKYLSGPELRALRHRPERIEGIERRRRTMAFTLAQLETVQEIRESLRTGGKAEFVDGFGQKIVLRGGDVRPMRVRDSDGALRASSPRDPNRLQVFPRERGAPIIVEHTLTDGRTRTQRALVAELRLPKAASAAAAGAGMVAGGPLAGGADDRARVAMSLHMREVSAQELDDEGELIVPDLSDDSAVPPAGAAPRAPAPGAIESWALTDLTLTDDPARRRLGEDAHTLLDGAAARAQSRPAERGAIEPAMRDLTTRISDLMREVLSKQHERVAMALACLVMVLVGTVMAMRLRDSLPLTIYLWAFFPALGAVITISAGQQMTHGSGIGGLPLLWGGVAALGALATMEFVKLIRH